QAGALRYGVATCARRRAVFARVRNALCRQTAAALQLSKAVTGEECPGEDTSSSARSRSLTFLCEDAVLRTAKASSWLHLVCAIVIPMAMSMLVRDSIAR